MRVAWGGRGMELGGFLQDGEPLVYLSFMDEHGSCSSTTNNRWCTK